MTDANTRQAQREATVDPEASARVLAERLRAGDKKTKHRFVLAAYLGSKEARAAVGKRCRFCRGKGYDEVVADDENTCRCSHPNVSPPCTPCENWPEEGYEMVRVPCSWCRGSRSYHSEDHDSFSDWLSGLSALTVGVGVMLEVACEKCTSPNVVPCSTCLRAPCTFEPGCSAHTECGGNTLRLVPWPSSEWLPLRAAIAVGWSVAETLWGAKHLQHFPGLCTYDGDNWSTCPTNRDAVRAIEAAVRFSKSGLLEDRVALCEACMRHGVPLWANLWSVVVGRRPATASIQAACLEIGEAKAREAIRADLTAWALGVLGAEPLAQNSPQGDPPNSR